MQVQAEVPSDPYATRCSETPFLGDGERGDESFAKRYPQRILVAEDNYANRQLLLALLRGLGYEAVACEDGRESLAAVLLGDFDVLLDDLTMGEMSGLECMQKIHKTGLSVAIIAMTASSPELSRNECLQAGMDGYLTKPVSLENLKDALREVWARRADLPHAA